MAQWKRAGPITQRSVGRNYLLLIFFKDFNRRGHRNNFLTNQRERIRQNLTTLSQKNHKTRSRVLKIPNTSRMAQWKRAGPITQRSVDRNYLLLNVFSRISERKEIETVTSQINKRKFGNIYTTLPQKNHKTRSTVFIEP